MTSISHDKRAVAPLVGAIFLLGFLVIGLSLYQVQIIPQENKQAEFEHSKQIQEELVELRDGTHKSGLNENSHGKSVTLGTHYNPRIIAINPPTPTGTISTVDPNSNITVVTDGNQANKKNFSTKFLTYEPQYREYQDPPVTTNEHTLVYNSFAATDTQQTVSAQQIFQSDNLIIPVLEGDVSETQSDAVSVRVTALEREQQSVDENVTVRLPTEVPELWIDEIESAPNIELVEQTETSVALRANVSTLTLYRLETDEVPQDDPTNSIAEEFGIPDGPVFCTTCDGDENSTDHDNVNNRGDEFANETLIIPEGTDFVPPEGSEGDDQTKDVDYLFSSYQIDGNVSTNKKITMEATDGAINFGSTGSAISGAQLDFIADGNNGSINVDGSTITTTAEDGQNVPGGGTNGIRFNTTGDISAVGTTLETNSPVEIVSGGSIDLTNATITVTSNRDIELDASEEIILNSTTLSLEDRGGQGASASGETIYVEDARFEGGADPLEIKDGEVVGEQTVGSIND